MADVTLTVALQPTADLRNIESQIDGLLKGFEGKKRPLRIDFELSKDAQATLDRINTSLNQIQSKATSTASAVKRANAGISGENIKKQTDNTRLAYKQIIKDAEKYYKTLDKYKKLSTDIFRGDNGVYQSKSGKWSILATELNDVTKAFDNIERSKNKLSQDLRQKLDSDLSLLKRKYGILDEQRINKQSERDNVQAIKLQEKAQKDAIKLQEKIQKDAERAESKSLSTLGKAEKSLLNWSKARNSANEESRAAYKNLENATSALREARKEYDGSAESAKHLAKAEKEASDTIKKTEEVLVKNEDASKSYGSRMAGLASKFASWLTISQGIMLAIRSVRKMVDEAIAVDDAMTQMQIVTKAGSGQMEQFGETAAKVAKKTSSSMTDIIDSATTYARLGYDMNTSTNLAEYTSMISKVGDINVADVQSAVTAIVKAFKIDATDTAQIQSVFDKLIVTGNNLPVSVSELAEGLNNAASSLAAGGNSYEESLAMLAASNATVQDISKSSTGLRTIVARIRNTKTELDSLGESMTDAEYNKIVETLTGKGVSLTDANGNLRDTFDILNDIARVSKDLKANSPNDYAALAETLAGTRMQNVFFSIVENWDEATKAMDLMGSDSLGALDTAFGTYEESISAHVQKFKTQFQELSTTVVGSDFAKGIVDIGTGLLSFATATSRLAGTLPTLASLVAIIKTIQSVS